MDPGVTPGMGGTGADAGGAPTSGSDAGRPPESGGGAQSGPQGTGAEAGRAPEGGVGAADGPPPTAAPERSVILTLIGRVNVGKSSLCNALLRRELASVDARSGWTKEVALYPVSDRLAVADTPGLDDPNPLIQDAAFDYAGDTDLFLHLNNLQEGVGQAAREALGRLRGTARPLAVVLTKLDLVAPAELAERVRDATAKLGAEGLPVYATSAQSGAGVQELADWIDGQVRARGDELAWARVCRRARPVLERRLDEEASACVTRFSLIAGGAGILPIPLMDLPIIAGVQVKMAASLGRIYGIELERGRLRRVMGMIAGGVLLRSIGRQAAKLIPWVGWAFSGAVAFGGTYGLGRALAAYYRGGMRADPEELRRIYRAELEKARVRFEHDPDLRRRAEEEGKSTRSGGPHPKS